MMVENFFGVGEESLRRAHDGGLAGA